MDYFQLLFRCFMQRSSLKTQFVFMFLILNLTSHIWKNFNSLQIRLLIRQCVSFLTRFNLNVDYQTAPSTWLFLICSFFRLTCFIKTGIRLRYHSGFFLHIYLMPPSPDDVKRFLLASEKPKVRLAISMLYATGMRLDELCHLRSSIIKDSHFLG